MNQGDSITTPNQHFDSYRSNKNHYVSGFHCHTVERLTDSIKTIILSVYESFRRVLGASKHCPKGTLQSGLHSNLENLWSAHLYMYRVPRVALA